MKAIKLLLIATALPFCFKGKAQNNYKMQPVAIQSRWAASVSPTNALVEYPRPQMTRPGWINLNGLWDYAITPKDQNMKVLSEGKILVPYPIESALSGVKKALLPDQELLYKRSFAKPLLKNGERLLLHFGAVDWKTTVYVNNKEVGTHTGGYTAFSFDVTDALVAGENLLMVKVYDPTDQGIGPHGKQVLNPQNIYYTPTSGIWQTVWLETVPGVSIASLDLTPDIDKGVLNALAWVSGLAKGYSVEFVALDNGKVINTVTAPIGVDATLTNSPIVALKINSAKLWSPANPFLYDLVVRLKKNGKVVDEIRSYFGMRKVSVTKDGTGVDRIFLNNKPYFNLGTLDQGFWPDGLYTAPTDEALAFDIKAIKAMGFNTIRKHIKVEPARWYYHADKLGMLVWQDMVNPNQGLPQGSKAAFEVQAKETLEQLHNYPSITTWVLFNEQWGSYDQPRLTAWIKKMDPSRIVNGHTGDDIFIGGEHKKMAKENWPGSDMTDIHSYPDPMLSPKLPGKAMIVGEFGGVGVLIPDHQWNTGWGYIQEKPAGLLAKYRIMTQHLKLLESEGLSGSIYTQPFDVESEQNGLMTYDREVVKIPFEAMRRINAMVNSNMGTIPVVTAKDADLTEPGILYSAMLDQYIAGKRDGVFLKRMAMMATQAGDKPGAQLAGSAYIATLRAPLSDEDINAVVSFTKSTRDAGFEMMVKDSSAFKKVLGDRKYTTAMMNMIFKGELEPMITASDGPDWSAIELVAKRYGAPGLEIFWRAKTVALFNKQDWKGFVPAASAYLEKYSANLSEQERGMFKKAVEEHK